MTLLANPYFQSSADVELPADVPFPSDNTELSVSTWKKFSVYKQTQLRTMHGIAQNNSVARLYLKDETQRMGLGSFKALGAAYAIAHEALATGGQDTSGALEGRSFVTASAGNHGISVAAGAKMFGARSIIYLAETVPFAFAERLRAQGAEVRVEGAEYEASMAAASKAAYEEELTLLSDSSWQGYYALPHRLMEGYLTSAKEITDQMPEVPSHVFLQAGVGGLACAMAAHFRAVWGSDPIITVVEPESAPALQASIAAGKSVFANGPVSNMGRLDCKEPSLIALKGLARDANFFLTISDDLAANVTAVLDNEGISSTPSGVAGLAGLFAGREYSELELDEASSVLCIISEGAE